MPVGDPYTTGTPKTPISTSRRFNDVVQLVNYDSVFVLLRNQNPLFRSDMFKLLTESSVKGSINTFICSRLRDLFSLYSVI